MNIPLQFQLYSTHYTYLKAKTNTRDVSAINPVAMEITSEEQSEKCLCNPSSQTSEIKSTEAFLPIKPLHDSGEEMEHKDV